MAFTETITGIAAGTVVGSSTTIDVRNIDAAHFQIASGSPTSIEWFASVDDDSFTTTRYVQVVSSAGDYEIPSGLAGRRYLRAVANSSSTLTVALKQVLPWLSQQMQFLEAIVAAVSSSIGPASDASYRLPQTSIYWRKHAQVRETARPCCLVVPMQEATGAGTNLSRDVSYRARVILLQSGNLALAADIDRMLYWRERLLDLFSDRRLSGFDAASIIRVETGPVFSPAAFAANEDESSIIVRAEVRRPNK